MSAWGDVVGVGGVGDGVREGVGLGVTGVFVGIGNGVWVGGDGITDLGRVAVGGVVSGAGVQVTGSHSFSGISDSSWVCTMLFGYGAVATRVGRYACAD